MGSSSVDGQRQDHLAAQQGAILAFDFDLAADAIGSDLHHPGAGDHVALGEGLAIYGLIVAILLIG